MKQNVLILLASICFLSSCRQKNKDNKQLLDQQIYDTLVSQCPNIAGKAMQLYYFDGDCSFCIGKVLELEGQRSKEGKMGLFIARTNNVIATRAVFKGAPVKSCILYDEKGRYEKYMQVGMIYLIDEEKHIVSSRPAQ